MTGEGLNQALTFVHTGFIWKVFLNPRESDSQNFFFRKMCEFRLLYQFANKFRAKYSSFDLPIDGVRNP